MPTRGKVGHQREIPCGPEGRLEEVQFGGLRRTLTLMGSIQSIRNCGAFLYLDGEEEEGHEGGGAERDV